MITFVTVPKTSLSVLYVWFPAGVGRLKTPIFGYILSLQKVLCSQKLPIEPLCVPKNSLSTGYVFPKTPYQTP